MSGDEVQIVAHVLKRSGHSFELITYVSRHRFMREILKQKLYEGFGNWQRILIVCEQGFVVFSNSLLDMFKASLCFPRWWQRL